MNSDDDFLDINFSFNSEDINSSIHSNAADLKIEQNSELILDDDFATFSSCIDIENESFLEESLENINIDTDINLLQKEDKCLSDDNELIFTNLKEYNLNLNVCNEKSIKNSLCDNQSRKKIKKSSILEEKINFTDFSCGDNHLIKFNEKNNTVENIKNLKYKKNEDIDEKKMDDHKYNTKNLDNNKIESYFKTGHNKKIEITKDLLKQPKFINCKINRPIRMYNIPEKGHVSTILEEKAKYMYFYEKLKKNFAKIECKLLKIQYRWVWLDLFLNKKLNENQETYNYLLKNISKRINSEYSILRRIIEGDDFSYKYMILLILKIDNNIIEVYDGYFSILIELDKILAKYFKHKKIQIGHKIKLFGCNFLLEKNISILDYNYEYCILKAFYNSFSTCYCTRKLGYKKKLSFRKRISEIEKEGGIVSCIKGTVKRVIESKFVVQVKDYRNTVEDLDSELENIKYLMDKTNESIEIEDVKIRKFVRFVLEDESGQCLITSWLYTDEIVKDKMIMFCGLIPISTALGIHLTTNKRTYVKFYTVK